jgi:hypothetical protein
MAGANIIVRQTSGANDSDAGFQALKQVSKLVADLETLRASQATIVTKLNADAGVTDTNYVATAASALTASKLTDHTGTVI